MAEHYKVREEDLLFILNEELHYGDLCNYDRYKELSPETLDMLVKEAIRFAKGVLEPLQSEGEKHGVRFENGKVYLAPGFREAFRLCGENGWIAAARDTTYGGMGFPHMMRIVINDIFYGACLCMNFLSSLTHGAGHLIESFGSEKLKELFVPQMYGGKWSGTMALTEPGAGSSLGNIKTTARREGDHFKIKGTKQFITYAEHDLAENIIHLLLARIEGAPEGTRGISLFVVPKIRVNDDGTLGEPNDVICAGVEQKMGLHASPTCLMSFGENDECIGYLCGEENRGLSHMFQMMNEARINIGVCSTTVASTAYLNALEYCKTRLQGRDLAKRKEGEVPIIDHPDVRRMLLWMKAMVDGMRSMVYATAYFVDIANEDPDESKRKRYGLLLDFMTPIVKGYCADMCFRVCEAAIQCLGGYGYCKDYPLEQYLRDSKIFSIFEGTSGIQSLDLLGRKMRIHSGEGYKAFIEELNLFLRENNGSHRFTRELDILKGAVERLKHVSDVMIRRMDLDPLQAASYSYPLLRCYGDIILAWRLLDMGIIADEALSKTGGSNKSAKKSFYQGKIFQATYFVDTILRQTLSRLDMCAREGREIIEIPDECF
ncbi:MAG TPA: acyl-CoA dehydrogenase [Desulfobacterales bacterium]|nr:acyl-CoA dehydrogenase [Desulfobacterales bacterium]